MAQKSISKQQAAKKSASKSSQGAMDPKLARRALETLLTTHYISRKRLYLENFIRGMFFSFGSVVGATILIVVIVWLLSLFDSLPVVGQLFEAIRESIKSAR